MTVTGDQPNGTSVSKRDISSPQELFLNGKYGPSSTGRTFPVLNPLTNKTLYECSSASVDDYSAAIDSAHEAFKTWSRQPPSARRLVLLRAADILESYSEQDAPEILSQEISAVASWVRNEIRGAAGVLRDAASLATHIKGEIIPADRPGTKILVERCPVGVVLAISPWNAPVVLTARAVASPLICGNTVVHKPSEHTPKCQHLVIRALLAAGLPPGAISFLPTSPADAPAVTEYAVKHPRVLRVNFTGSDRVGRIIAGWAATCLKQCVLELGGKAPVIVLDDADIADAVEAVVFGALWNSGQICMSTERVIVQESIAEEFTKALVERIEKVTYGSHEDDASVLMSGLFSPSSLTRITGLIQEATKQGANLLTGDLQASGPASTVLRPHVLCSVTPEMSIFHSETFGPVVCVTTCKTDAEAIDLANATDFSLAAAVFSKDIMRALEVTRQVRSGSCHINGPTVYIEAPLPNGGTGGSSGYGRFGGVAGIEAFTEKKIVTLAEKGMKYPMFM
jgi:acyl-CoA reductase-like NAD-dependent aldehyde dehydrogenase